MIAKGLVLDYFSFVNFLAVFIIARLLFEPRIFFVEFFLGEGVIEMKVNIFLVGDFFIATGILVAFPPQSENDKILQFVFGTNTLRSPDL